MSHRRTILNLARSFHANKKTPDEPWMMAFLRPLRIRFRSMVRAMIRLEDGDESGPWTDHAIDRMIKMNRDKIRRGWPLMTRNQRRSHGGKPAGYVK